MEPGVFDRYRYYRDVVNVVVLRLNSLVLRRPDNTARYEAGLKLHRHE